MDFARSVHPGVQAQLDRLSWTSPNGDRLGLERIGALLDRLGRPQDSLPPVFHIAGTNGKGSTVALLRAGMEAAGLSVHAFTSPHLVRFNERIRVAGKLIEDEPLEALLREIISAGSGIEPSFFEVATAVAIAAFSRTPADAAILEVGLGGRLDATNIVERPAVCGIASIGLDHQQHLGSTIGEIAAEKAAIAKPGVSLVALAQPAEAGAMVVRVAEAAGARLLLEGRDWQIDPSLVPTLPGAHQIRNANLAWQMLRSQTAISVSREALLEGLKTAQWPARFQRMASGPVGDIETYVDGAHNDDAARALGAHLATVGPMHIVLGILANKNADAIVGALKPHALSLTFVPVRDHPSHDPETLAVEHGGRADATLERALAPLSAPRLIAGSLYLAGEALALNGEMPD
jgi:dihydrofolate synthase/folylpolyglutamate synthase